MSSPIISFLTISLTSSLLIIISSPKIIDAIPSSSQFPLIEKACSNASMNTDTDLCLVVLKSVPAIVSAKDLLGLSVAIIETGISNSTNTLKHIEAVLGNATSTAAKGAYEECKFSYGQVVDRFTAALEDTKKKEYVAPTYYLLTASTDCINSCTGAMESRNVQDDVVWKGNQIVPIFGFSAFSVIAELQLRSPPPPS